ncbi:MAG: hypothetical protein V1755_03200 [Chloroflexota bacterium]
MEPGEKKFQEFKSLLGQMNLSPQDREDAVRHFLGLPAGRTRGQQMFLKKNGELGLAVIDEKGQAIDVTNGLPLPDNTNWVQSGGARPQTELDRLREFVAKGRPPGMPIEQWNDIRRMTSADASQGNPYAAAAADSARVNAETNALVKENAMAIAFEREKRDIETDKEKRLAAEDKRYADELQHPQAFVDDYVKRKDQIVKDAADAHARLDATFYKPRSARTSTAPPEPAAKDFSIVVQGQTVRFKTAAALAAFKKRAGLK